MVVSAHIEHKKKILTSTSLLFTSLISIVVLYGIFSQAPFITGLMNLLLSMTILACMWTLISSKAPNSVIGLAGIVAIVTLWMTVATSNSAVHILNISAMSFLFVLTMRKLFIYILDSNKIRAHHVYSAFSVYLLMGVLFSTIYAGIYTQDSTSFVTEEEIRALEVSDWSDFLYFSFSTLTTTGFGDIIPNSATTEMIAIIEAGLGAMFIGVIIAALMAGKRN